MKTNKRFISLIVTLIMLVNCLIFGAVEIFAHSTLLDVEYDECVASGGDGEDEMWYELLYEDFYCYHISDEVPTITYYYEEPSSDFLSQAGITAYTASVIKNAYIDSMKKWNNVYFYSYDDQGKVVKKKIINVVEGTAENHVVSISLVENQEYIAQTTTPIIPDSLGQISHRHKSDWNMFINVDLFHGNDGLIETVYNLLRARTGAHELGHVLGLIDVDNVCQSGENVDGHHEEILMGYGYLTNRASNITYKDIAGVAITRGFHTDADHKWLNCGVQADGKYKLICSICNGVKYVTSLSGYTYNTYNACNENHTLSSGNMMAVASYGTKDYYKCKYCRWVAPFSANKEQNYIGVSVSLYQHEYVNDVEGLEYTLAGYENHNRVGCACEKCGKVMHLYNDRYVSNGPLNHKSYCECGLYIIESHVIRGASIMGTNASGKCYYCGALFNSDLLSIQSTEELEHTDNGSYILPNGVIVLQDADLEAYLAGTLVFHRDDENELE